MGIEKLKVDFFLSSAVVSLARAAEISEHSLSDFIFLLKNKNMPWGEYTEKDMQLDEAFIKNYMSEKGENDEGSSM